MSQAQTLIVIAVALVAPIGMLLLIYNSLVRIRNLCTEAWADVETELQRRHDLIPNLVSAVKGYTAHERQVIENVTRLREACMAHSGSVRERAGIETQLGVALTQLQARIEAYPNLKASQDFLDLQHELTNTEDRIQAARRFYNGNVRENNNLVQSFPSNLVASTFGFNERDFFELEDGAARNAPQVALN
jgi:LemA protein